MNQMILRVSPLPAAKVFAVVYFVMGILVLPFLLLPVIFGSGEAGFGVVFIASMPIFYAIAGFAGTAFICSLYNAVAPRIGGIQIEVRSDSLE